MSLKIKAVNLISRLIRKNTIVGKTGRDLLSSSGGISLRKIDFAGKLTKGQGKGGLVEWTFNALGGFTGWVFSSLLGGLQWTISKTWGVIVGTTEKLKSFNWNATEQELENAIKARNDQLAGIWGGVLGSGVGWLAGIGVGAGVSYLCPVIGGASLARVVAGAAGAEALEDLKTRLETALNQTATLITASLSANFYMNYRSFLRNAPKETLKIFYDDATVDFIQNQWGRGGQPEISFNKKMDDFVEKLPGGQAVKNFVENFLEEAWDSFIEAGFVISHQLDEAYQQSKLAAKAAVLGEERSFEIQLDKNAPNLTVAYSGVPERLIPGIAQQTINIHRMIHDRDIGELVGEPFSEGYQAALPQQRKLTIVFRESEKPPYKPLGKTGKLIQIAIPDLKIGTSWRDVKAVCDSYLWGPCYAVGKLANRRSITVWASTQDLAVRKVRAFAALSSSKLLTINKGQEEQKDARLLKRPLKIYPAYCTLLYRREAAEGRTQLDGKTLSENIIKIPLWPTEPPAGKSILDLWDKQP